MTIHRRCQWTFTIAAALAIAAGSAAKLHAFSPLVREPILNATLAPDAPLPKIIRGARIRFAPSQPTGLHQHPVAVVGVVTQGSFTFQVDGQPARTLGTGDPFYEPARTRILQFDNASPDSPAEIVAFYLTDNPDRPLIEMLDSGGRPSKAP